MAGHNPAFPNVATFGDGHKPVKIQSGNILNWSGFFMMTLAELNTLAARECLIDIWGDNATAVLAAIDTVDAVPMSSDEFLNHCTSRGGTQCALLLSGIEELYPAVWEAIPDNMGEYALHALSTVLELLQIEKLYERV